MKGKEIVLLIKNGVVVCPWWSKEAADFLCKLCGQQESEKCETCLNRNPWCG